MTKQHYRTALIQIPIIIGITAAVGVAAIFLGKMLAQNLTPPQPNSENNQTMDQPGQSNQPMQPNQPEQQGQPQPMQPGQEGQPYTSTQPNQPGQQNPGRPNQNQLNPNQGQPPQSWTGQQPMQNNNQPNGQNQPNNQNQNMTGPQQDQNNFNPAEVQNVTREISQIKTSVKSLLKKAAKASNLSDEASQLTEMSQELDKISSDLKSTSDQDELQSIVSDFRDANYQEAMQALRTKIEMPAQITSIKKDLKKLTTNLKSKSIINAMAKIGFDLTPLQSVVDTVNSTLTTIQDNYNSGDLDDAASDMQDLMDNQAPADINCVLTSFQEFSRNITKVKDATTLSAVQDLFTPIKDAAASGEYHDACMSMNGVRPTLTQLFNAISRSKATLNSTVQQKLNNLQNLINQTFPGSNATTTPETNQPNPAP
ncbi:MAG: hypothetical protein NTY61_03300 [Candidatus Parcubacteria bacterium]|nr:hypothetical protein [Candidatus Parcubacteria bacterium]